MDTLKKMLHLLMIIICAGANFLMEEVEPPRRRRRLVWTEPYLLRREERGAYNNILNEFRAENQGKFRKCVRMNPETFDVSFIHLASLLNFSSIGIFGLWLKTKGSYIFRT